eukprot:scaffold15406_cov119-Isochrysis_galbana.AAC.10
MMWVLAALGCWLLPAGAPAGPLPPASGPRLTSDVWLCQIVPVQPRQRAAATRENVRSAYLPIVLLRCLLRRMSSAVGGSAMSLTLAQMAPHFQPRAANKR